MRVEDSLESNHLVVEIDLCHVFFKEEMEVHLDSLVLHHFHNQRKRSFDD